MVTFHVDATVVGLVDTSLVRLSAVQTHFHFCVVAVLLAVTRYAIVSFRLYEIERAVHRAEAVSVEREPCFAIRTEHTREVPLT